MSIASQSSAASSKRAKPGRMAQVGLSGKIGNFSFLQTFIQDLEYAVRSLSKHPGFVSVVVASLALGIGANSPIFSVMNALVYRPLPYRGDDRMVAIG